MDGRDRGRFGRVVRSRSALRGHGQGTDGDSTTEETCTAWTDVTGSPAQQRCRPRPCLRTPDLERQDRCLRSRQGVGVGTSEGHEPAGVRLVVPRGCVRETQRCGREEGDVPGGVPLRLYLGRRVDAVDGSGLIVLPQHRLLLGSGDPEHVTRRDGVWLGT